MHPVHNESESYSPTIICRHCVEQQTDSLVFTEFQSDHRAAIEKWEGETISRPLASKFGGTLALPALQLVPPCQLSPTNSVTHFCKCNGVADLLKTRSRSLKVVPFDSLDTVSY